MPDVIFGAKTSSGAELPIFSMAQNDLLTVDSGAQPFLRDALGPGVHFKALRLDLDGGVWVVLASLDPGVVLPLHYHTGPAEVFTLSGTWHYREYPDQPQVAGSYLYEPAGSVHTFQVPEDAAEPAVLFIRVDGSNVNFNEDGTFHSLLDTPLIYGLTQQLAAAQGTPVTFIVGDEQEEAKAG